MSTVHEETVTLSEAKRLIVALADQLSILLLSPPGTGKSEAIQQAATEGGLECRSLLGTQIAPEDVSGIPRIVDERSVFCPPRVLLPPDPKPFCLLLDELPACAPDIQKAFYSLLLERRLGEHPLPSGTWVVGAGNRIEDRALVRGMSTALVNRLIVLNVRVDVREWLAWASRNGIRPEIQAFILVSPDSLVRPAPSASVPFSTPRSWTQLSRALDRVENAGGLSPTIRRALAFGTVSAPDAEMFTALDGEMLGSLLPPSDYIRAPDRLPTDATARWWVLSKIRHLVGSRWTEGLQIPPETIDDFLAALPEEQRMAAVVGLVHAWGGLGACDVWFDTLRELTGMPE